MRTYQMACELVDTRENIMQLARIIATNGVCARLNVEWDKLPNGILEEVEYSESVLEDKFSLVITFRFDHMATLTAHYRPSILCIHVYDLFRGEVQQWH